MQLQAGQPSTLSYGVKSRVMDRTTWPKTEETHSLAYLIGDQVHMGASLDCADGVDKADLQTSLQMVSSISSSD